MRYSSAIGVLAAAAATANAQTGTTIKVSVGENGLTYTPNNITAAVGTAIEFDFFPKNHTVTQSSFADPCHPLNTNGVFNGFFSGFVPTASSPSGSTFTIIVNDTTPIWFYCAQTTGNHCQSGMVGSINAPTTGNKTLAAFEALAKVANTSSTPPEVAGGILKIASNSTSGSSGSVSTVTSEVTTTVVKTVTAQYSTYTTTYGTTYASTFTTAAAQASGSGSGSSSSTSSSTTSSSTSKSTSGAVANVAVNGGMAGAVLVAALAML